MNTVTCRTWDSDPPGTSKRRTLTGPFSRKTAARADKRMMGGRCSPSTGLLAVFDADDGAPTGDGGGEETARPPAAGAGTGDGAWSTTAWPLIPLSGRGVRGLLGGRPGPRRSGVREASAGPGVAPRLPAAAAPAAVAAAGRPGSPSANEALARVRGPAVFIATVSPSPPSGIGVDGRLGGRPGPRRGGTRATLAEPGDPPRLPAAAAAAPSDRSTVDRRRSGEHDSCRVRPCPYDRPVRRGRPTVCTTACSACVSS